MLDCLIMVQVDEVVSKQRAPRLLERSLFDQIVETPEKPEIDDRPGEQPGCFNWF